MAERLGRRWVYIESVKREHTDPDPSHPDNLGYKVGLYCHTNPDYFYTNPSPDYSVTNPDLDFVYIRIRIVVFINYGLILSNPDTE